MTCNAAFTGVARNKSTPIRSRPTESFIRQEKNFGAILRSFFHDLSTGQLEPNAFCLILSRNDAIERPLDGSVTFGLGLGTV